MTRHKRITFDEWMEHGISNMRPLPILTFFLLAVFGVAAFFGSAWIALGLAAITGAGS